MQIVKCCSNSKVLSLDLVLNYGKNEIKKGINQVFVLPDSASEKLKNQIIKNITSGATFNLDIVSFSELKKFARLPLNKTKIKKIDAQFFIKQILETNRQQLKCFSMSKITLTFCGLIYDIIVKLKSNKVDIKQFYIELSNVQNLAIKNKLFDICFVFEKYQQFLNDNGFYDEIDEQVLVAQNLKEDKNILNTNFNFCCFDRFTKQQFDVIEAFVKTCNLVNFGVVVPNDVQQNVDIFLNLANTQIDEIAKKINIKPQNICNFEEKNAFKKQICENLFTISSNLTPLNANGEIVVLNANDIETEISYVAKRIVWLIKNDMCRFSDIIVCLPDKNLYQPIFKNVFNKFDISFSFCGGINLEDTKCFNLILDALNCVKNNFLTNDVLKLVYNPVFGIPYKKVEFIETMAFKYGIENEMWVKPVINKSGGEIFEKFEILKHQIVQPILEFKTELETAKTTQDFCLAVKNLFVNVNAEQNLKNIETKNVNSLTELKYSQIQSYEKILNALDELCENIADAKVDLFEFETILCDVVGKRKLPKLGQTMDSVFVGDVKDISGFCSKYLFVLGVNDGVFPASKNDVGILSDSDILSLNCLDGIETVLQQNINKKFDVLQVLLCGEELCLSYANNGLSEKRLPSTVVDGIKKLFCFNGRELPVVKIEDLLLDAGAFGGEENRICFNIATYKNALDFFATENCLNDAFDAVFNLFLSDGYNIENILKSFEVEECIFKAKELFFPNGSTKVSQLESYFLCPFKHFVDYGLKLSEKEKSNIKASEIGDVLHAVAECFVKENIEKTLKSEEILEISNKIFEKVILEPKFEHLLLDNKNKTILQGLKLESCNVCNAIYYQNSHSQFDVKFCEAVFGDPNFADILSFNVDGEKLLLKGKVDRVDMFENYVRVIDYKTGKTSAEYKTLNLFNGKKIQLFVYMWAILKGMKKLDLQPAGVFLMPLHNEWTNVKAVSTFEKYKLDGTTLKEEKVLRAQDDQVCLQHPKSDIVNFSISTSKKNESDFIPSNRTGNLVSVEKFNQMIDYSIAVSEKAISEMLGGYISAKPFESSCAFCKAKSFCNFTRQTAKKVRNDKFKIDDKTFSGEEDEKNNSTTASN